MKKEINDFIIEILQDFNELYSTLKVLKDSVANENSETDKCDILNTLEIIISKMYNVKNSLKKYIELTIK